MADFSAYIDQTALDKLLQSTSYPLVLSEKKEPFPGCSNLAVAEEDDYYRYSDDEVDDLFEECVRSVRSDSDRTDQTVEDQLYAFGGSIIQQAKVIFDASQSPEYEGPTRVELQNIIDGGIENLGAGLRSVMGDWGLYAWCPLLRVTLKNRPNISLKSPRLDLEDFNIEVRATGELFAKYPWWNCHKWCLKWYKVIKCDRIAHIAVSPDIEIDAHADFIASGQKVFAVGQFDRLRLDYPILKEIPLERLINPTLAGKKIIVYDSTRLIATLPILNSQFEVRSISLPIENNGLTVEMVIEEV